MPVRMRTIDFPFGHERLRLPVFELFLCKFSFSPPELGQLFGEFFSLVQKLCAVFGSLIKHPADVPWE